MGSIPVRVTMKQTLRKRQFPERFLRLRPVAADNAAGMPPLAMRARVVCIRYAIGHCSVRYVVQKASLTRKPIMETAALAGDISAVLQ